MGFWKKIKAGATKSLSAAKTKIKNSMRIVGYSFAAIWKDKKYFLFSFIAFITFVAIISTILLSIEYTVTLKEAFNFIEDVSKETDTEKKVAMSAINVFIFLASYIVFSTVAIATTTIFSVATTYYTLRSFEGDKTSIINSVSYSLSKWWTIIKWGFVASIVAILLQGIKKEKRGENSGWFLLFITGGLSEIIDIAWGLATFLVPAVIAFEDLNLYNSIKKSTKVMKNTFGEIMVANLGFRFLSYISTIALLILSVIFVLIPIREALPKELSSLTAVLTMSPMFLIPTFGLFFISIAKTIFKTAVYAYATGKPTGEFPPDLIKQSFYTPDKTRAK